MKLRRSGSLRNRHRGRAAVAGGLSAAMLAAGVLATSPAAYASSSHITLEVQGPPGRGPRFTRHGRGYSTSTRRPTPKSAFPYRQ